MIPYADSLRGDRTSFINDDSIGVVVSRKKKEPSLNISVDLAGDLKIGLRLFLNSNLLEMSSS